MCKSMKVSKNSYYHWMKSKEKIALETPKMYLMRRVRMVFEENRQIYGRFRIQKMLEREGLKYSRPYVGLLMKEMGLKSILRKKYVVTTDSKHSFVFHSDRGVQYASNKMRSIFSYNIKITQSMSRKGNCWDNAVAESFFKASVHNCVSAVSSRQIKLKL